MENKRVLFITFDMSGYYDAVRDELKTRYAEVDYYNTAALSYRYKNLGEKIYSSGYKLFTGKKLKNYLKLRDLTEAVASKQYDIALIVRPDLFFDSQLETIRKSSKRMIAYYHDSVNNIPRKKDVIKYFDAVWAYEKADAEKYNLNFIPNFIYFQPQTDAVVPKGAFTVASYDYRFAVLEKVAAQLKAANFPYRFFVMSDKPRESDLVTFISRRMQNPEVIAEIKNASIIVDIHKYGVQDGLTFRTFEALGFARKLITTNRDVRNYEFFDEQNIFVIDDVENFAIPTEFLESPYRPVPENIVEKFTVAAWLDQILM